MDELSFENQKARAIYQRVLSKTPLADDKKKVKEIFTNQARLDENPTLSEAEAKQAEAMLNYYDNFLKTQIGIYNSPEIDKSLDESYAAIKLHSLYKKHLSNPADPKITANLILYMIQTTNEGLVHPKIIEVVRRLNPDLNPEDNRLLTEFENAPNLKAKTKVADKIIDRIKWLKQEMLEKYDGIVSPVKSKIAKRIIAFSYALNCFTEDKHRRLFERLSAINLNLSLPHLSTLKDSSYLSNTAKSVGKKRELLGAILFHFYFFSTTDAIQGAKDLIRENQATFRSIVSDAAIAFATAPLGDKSKIAAFRRCYLLSNLAAAAGVNIPSSTFSLTIEDKRETALLLDFQETEMTPEKNDDYHLRHKATEQVARLAQNYSRVREAYFSNPSPKSQSDFHQTESLLKDYIYSALRFGCSFAEIEEIIQAHGIFEQNIKYPTLDLSEVKKWHALHLSPADLPQEVKTILQEIGIYEDIARDIHSIYLTKKLEEPVGKLLQVDVSGKASPFTRSLWIAVDYAEVDERALNQITATLIHEWLHVKWTNNNLFYQERWRNTPSERNSFLGESQFMRVYLEKIIARHRHEIEEYETLLKETERSESDHESIQSRIKQLRQGIVGTIIELAQFINDAKKTGLAANRPLGYPTKDDSPRADLPHNSDELDLDIYPRFINSREERESEGNTDEWKEILFEAGYPFRDYLPY